MNNEEFVKAVVEALDADTSLGVFAYKNETVKSLLARWKSEGNHNLPNEVTWEFVVMDTATIYRGNRKASSQEHIYDFKGILQDEQAIVYFRARSEATKNPIRKALYADIVWTALSQHHDPTAYQYGLVAGNSYLDQVPLCIAQQDIQWANIMLVENIYRAAEIAVQLNNRDLARRVVESIKMALAQLLYPAPYRWVIEMGESLELVHSEFSDLVGTQIWQQIAKTVANGIDHFSEQGNLNLAVELMALGSTTARQLGEPTKAWAYMVKQAEAYENEARESESREGPGGGKMVAFRHMETALYYYQKLLSYNPEEDEKSRLQEKAQVIRRELRRLLREAPDEMEYVSDSVEIPVEDLEALIVPLLDAPSKNVLTLLSLQQTLVPDIIHIRQQAQKSVEEHVFLNLAPQITIRDGRKVDETSAFESEVAAFYRQLGIWLQVQAQILDFVLHRLREENLFSPEAYMAHLDRWEFLDEQDVPFIKAGLERYFAGDYISALHVLTPRIEHMLRSAFEQMGVVPISLPNRRHIREQTFGEFLRRPEVRSSLGENIWYYLNFTLIDERGWNLRNDVAHGWISTLQCDRFTVQVVMFAILLLTRALKEHGAAEDISDTSNEGDVP